MRQNKLWIVARREYRTRITRKSFILTTLLIPFLIAALPAAIFLVTNDSRQVFAVVDETGHGIGLASSPTMEFRSERRSLDELVALVESGQSGLTGILRIQLDSGSIRAELTTAKRAGLRTRLALQSELSRASTQLGLKQRGLDDSDIARLQTTPALKIVQLGSNGATGEQELIAYVCAFGVGVIMYVSLIIYGVLVMNGVVEEKTNRIVEMIVSSVRPFQMMLGKILGVAAVGLTQLTIWIVLGGILMQFVLPMALPTTELQSAIQSGNFKVEEKELADAVLRNLASIDWTMLILGFLLYFVAGYFFYAAQFAAAASAANDASDLNSLSFPITLPLILSFIVMNVVIQEPNGALAFWFSIIPFTSPVVMIGRIPFGVPWWEFGLSLILLVGGFIGTSWIAAKIYRTGILLYGKKHSFRELIRWMRA